MDARIGIVAGYWTLTRLRSSLVTVVVKAFHIGIIEKSLNEKLRIFVSSVQKEQRIEELL